MFDKREECPICGHPKFQNFHICTDHTVTCESFALVKCTQCTHVFTNPKPTDEHLAAYYQSAQYISHANAITSLTDLLYKLVRIYTLRKKRKLIEELAKGQEKSLLDFGCGTGHFLHACKKHGWRVTGVEPNSSARKQAQQGDTPVEESLTTIKEKYAIITSWHVLEHTTDPVSVVRELRSKLQDGGHIIIALPNHASYDAKYYGKYWAGYDVPRHLSHFNRSSFKSLADKTKLKIQDIRPMTFDAFYVSILSEKYQRHPGALLKGLQIGRKSNASAKLTGEYSSLIYLLTK